MKKPARRFPPPWSIEDIGAAYVVKDSSGQKLGYFYYEKEAGPAIGGIEMIYEALPRKHVLSQRIRLFYLIRRQRIGGFYVSRQSDG